MKYAKLGPQKGILNIIDTTENPNADISNCEALTSDQVSQVEAIRGKKQPPIWYKNTVTSFVEQLSKGIRLMWDVKTGDFIETVIPIPPTPVHVISKLAIRRKLREWGKEETFDAMLDGFPHARSDWSDATEIKTSDPLFTTNKEAFKGILKLTEDQYNTLMSL